VANLSLTTRTAAAVLQHKNLAVVCLGGLFLGACALPEPVVDPSLAPIAAPLIESTNSELDGENEAKFDFSTSMPQPYSLTRDGTTQAYLPQMQPGVRVDFDGDTNATLSVTQLLFDGNQREARVRLGDAQAVQKHVDLVAETNDEISDDIRTYLSYWEHKETEKLLKEVADWVEDILATAQTRATGGIGKASEVSLFQLKLNELRADAAIAASQAKIDQISLEDTPVTVKPIAVPYKTDVTPILVSQRLAAREVAQFEYALKQRQSTPSVSLRGDAGYNFDEDDTTTDTGLSIDGEPMTFGRPAQTALAEEALSLAQSELRQAVKETAHDIKRQEAQIRALKTQHAQSKALLSQAKERLEGFPDLFSAGSASLTEATSLADSLRRAYETEIETRYRIMNLQREIARQSGSFWQ